MTDETPGTEARPGQRGTNQAGMRAQNERLVLSLVRRHGALAKSDLARMTGLSAQTVSVIMRQLEADRLLRRGKPQRGRVGQPSVPFSLDPEGAYFLGTKIGRRSLDLVLVDFTGKTLKCTSQTYDYPKPRQIIDQIRAEARSCEHLLGAQAKRLAGLGIAMPFALWNWAEEMSAPASEMAIWQELDIQAELGAVLPYPVYLQNDATAACGAELAFGTHAGLSDFIYFYIGAFIGGGLVLGGELYTGRTGNAAAVGSMPVPGPGAAPAQLINRASLVLLERSLDAAGLQGVRLYRHETEWSAFGAELDAWLVNAGEALAHAIAAAAAVIDFEAAVIDGAMPPAVQERLLGEIRRAIDRLDLSGIQPPDLRPGTIGPIARALGGASLPLFDRFLVDQTRRVAPTRPAG